MKNKEIVSYKGQNVMLYKYDDCPTPSFDGKYRNIDIKLLKYLTHRVRRTIEYRNFINHLKNNMNINKCTFYRDYTIEKGFTIELHHAPFTMFDYVQAVVEKHFSGNRPYLEPKENNPKDKYIETWAVEEEVLLLHYDFMVGLTPLNPTAHSLVHSDKLRLHPSMVQGDWKKFYTEYEDYVSDEVKGKYAAFVELGKDNPEKLPEILKYKPILISNVKYKSLGSVRVEELVINKLKKRLTANK